MENLDRKLGYPESAYFLTSPNYLASSIYDMLSSRDQVFEDMRDARHKWAGKGLKGIMRSSFAETLPFIANVIIPGVRHAPVKDMSEKGMIILFDSTGECEVTFPGTLLQKGMLREMHKALGTELPVIKDVLNSSCQSDVMLINLNHPRDLLRDMFKLVYIDEPPVHPEMEHEESKGVVLLPNIQSLLNSNL